MIFKFVLLVLKTKIDYDLFLDTNNGEKVLKTKTKHMNQEKTKITIISDLVKIARYRSHLANADKLFTQDMYSDVSIDDLKKIHDIYTRYLLDYKKLHEPYPSVIEKLEYTNQQIDGFIKDHKGEIRKAELS